MANPIYAKFDPEDHYWFIGNDRTQVYASKRGIYVAASDATYVTWLTGQMNTDIVATEDELWALLAQLAPNAAKLRAEAMDKLKDSEIVHLSNGGKLSILAKVFLNHENRIRALEAKTPITMAQFKAGVKALL